MTGWRRRATGGKKLDRGRATRNASWCYVFFRENREGYLLPYEVAKKRGVDKKGIFFRSKREAARYLMLLDEERRCHIRSLRRQVAFPLYAVRPDRLKEVVCRYFADFVYERRDNRGAWQTVVEDSKGFLEDAYKLKRAWLKAQDGIEIFES